MKRKILQVLRALVAAHDAWDAAIASARQRGRDAPYRPYGRALCRAEVKVQRLLRDHPVVGALYQLAVECGGGSGCSTSAEKRAIERARLAIARARR